MDFATTTHWWTPANTALVLSAASLVVAIVAALSAQRSARYTRRQALATEEATRLARDAQQALGALNSIDVTWDDQHRQLVAYFNAGPTDVTVTQLEVIATVHLPPQRTGRLSHMLEDLVYTSDPTETWFYFQTAPGLPARITAHDTLALPMAPTMWLDDDVAARVRLTLAVRATTNTKVPTGTGDATRPLTATSPPFDFHIATHHDRHANIRGYGDRRWGGMSLGSLLRHEDLTAAEVRAFMAPLANTHAITLLTAQMSQRIIAGSDIIPPPGDLSGRPTLPAWPTPEQYRAQRAHALDELLGALTVARGGDYRAGRA